MYKKERNQGNNLILLSLSDCSGGVCPNPLEGHCPDGRSLADYSGNISLTDGGRQCKSYLGTNSYCRNMYEDNLPSCSVAKFTGKVRQYCAERICGGQFNQHANMPV